MINEDEKENRVFLFLNDLCDVLIVEEKSDKFVEWLSFGEWDSEGIRFDVAIENESNIYCVITHKQFETIKIFIAKQQEKKEEKEEMHHIQYAAGNFGFGHRFFYWKHYKNWDYSECKGDEKDGATMARHFIGHEIAGAIKGMKQ